MNKESIYRIIGYHGEYTESVKKALKKLLKDNHPDKGGDIEIFKIVNEVKKELESGKVSFKNYDKEEVQNKYSDIDYDYCEKMIKKCQKYLDVANQKIEDLELEIKKANENYKKLYQNSQEERKYLLNNSNDAQELIRIKGYAIIMLIFVIIIFSVAILKNNLIIFGVFGLLCLFFIGIMIKYFQVIRRIADNNKNNLSKYIKLTSRLTSITEKREELSKKHWLYEQKKKKVENDLRFYNNLIKYK